MSPERRLLFPASSSAAMRAAGTWTRYSLVFSPAMEREASGAGSRGALDERERGTPAPSTSRAAGSSRGHGGAATASRRDASRAAAREASPRDDTRGAPLECDDEGDARSSRPKSTS